MFLTPDSTSEAITGTTFDDVTERLERLLTLFVLLVLGGVFLAAFYRRRRALEFAIATAALYVGGLRLLAEAIRGEGGLFLIAIWSAAALIFLIAATRRMRRAE